MLDLIPKAVPVSDPLGSAVLDPDLVLWSAVPDLDPGGSVRPACRTIMGSGPHPAHPMGVLFWSFRSCSLGGGYCHVVVWCDGMWAGAQGCVSVLHQGLRTCAGDAQLCSLKDNKLID